MFTTAACVFHLRLHCHTAVHVQGSTGNPLRVLSKKQIAVRLRAYVNPFGAAAGGAGAGGAATAPSLALASHPQHVTGAAEAQCNASWNTNVDYFGNDYRNVENTTQEACCAFCVADPQCSAVTWNGPDGPYKDRNCNMKTSSEGAKGRVGQLSAQVRPNQHPSPSPPRPSPPPPSPNGHRAFISTIKWATGYPAGAFAAISTATEALSPVLTPEEQTRVDLQHNITDGWGCWGNSVLDLVLMPEAAKLTVGICQISTGECVASTRPSDTDTMRVAEHAYDKAYVRMFLTVQGGNFSIEFASGTGASSSNLEVAITPMNCASSTHGSTERGGLLGAGTGTGTSTGGINCSDFAATFTPGFNWNRHGAMSTGAQDIHLEGFGLRGVDLHFTSPTNPRLKQGGNGKMAFVLGAAGGGLSTSSKNATSFGTIASNMAAAHAALLAEHAKYGELAEVYRALQAAVMWCLLYVPAELGPFAPVSRSWAFLTPKRLQPGDEWIYVIFDWDNIFASYMFAMGDKNWAYSNLIQVTKTLSLLRGSCGYQGVFFHTNSVTYWKCWFN